MKTKTVDHARDQAQAQLESIKEMVSALTATEGNGREELEAYERAEQTIQEDALSVEVRSDWHNVGEIGINDEFKILLCTGGPAVRILGTLADHGEPATARLEYQDWGTPWTEYRLTADDEETVLRYCRCFYFGE